MATYRFKCEDCDLRFDISGIPIEERDEWPVECPECESMDCIRIMQNEMRFHFKENFNRTESAKPDSYWDSAERNRLARLDGARKERFDKVMSGDKETCAMIERKANNQERLGKDMNDQARIEEASQLRELLGEKQTGKRIINNG